MLLFPGMALLGVLGGTPAPIIDAPDITPTAGLTIRQTAAVVQENDSVRFTPSDWVGFDTARGPLEHYDARYHDIVYFWETSREGDYAAPRRVINKSAGVQRGPVCVVRFPSAGRYAVKCTAYETKTGKIAVEEATVNVLSLDSQYPGEQTICVANGDAAGAPDGARIVTIPPGGLVTDLGWSNALRNGPVRVLFERGGRFNVQIDENAGNIASGLYYGAFGPTSQKPILTTPGRMFSHSGWDEVSPGVAKKLFLNSLRIEGDYNPATGTGNQGRIVVNVGAGAHIVHSDLEVDGLGGRLHDHADGNNRHRANFYHWDDCSYTNFGGYQYPIFIEAFTDDEGTCAFTGNRIVRAPDTAQDDTELRAPIRQNGNAYTVFHDNEMFSNTGSGQPVVKVGELGNIPGGLYSLSGNTIEGGREGCMRFKANKSAKVTSNLVMRQNVLLPGTQAFAAVDIQATGASIDANLIVAAGTKGRIVAQSRMAFQFDGRSNPSAPDALNKVRNNTAVNHKDAAENISDKYDVVFSRDGAMAIDENNNNVVAQPSINPVQAGKALWPFLNTGRQEGGSFNEGWASKPATVFAFNTIGEPASDGFPFPIDAASVADISTKKGCWDG